MIDEIIGYCVDIVHTLRYETPENSGFSSFYFRSSLSNDEINDIKFNLSHLFSH